MKYYVDLNLNQNELQNVVLQNLASAPENPKPGQHYYNTTDHTEYFWNGTAWINAAGDYTFQNGIEQVTGSRNVQLKLNTAASTGLATFSTDSNGLKIEVNEASTTTKGLIEIATDAECTTGTSETLAVNPKQLKTKVDANAAITAGTGTVITYDAKGLVTSSSELAIKSTSTNYLEYDSSTHQFGAKVDTNVTANSTNLVTSGAVKSAIDAAIAGGIHYAGTWDITSATDYSGITLPVSKGALYYVTGTGPKTIGGIEWNQGDYLLVNDDVEEGGSLVGKVEKIDNTESADIVRLNATQTLTNKTIDADDNTISDLTTSNLKSGVLQTSVRAATSATDTALASEKAIRTELDTKQDKVVAAVENNLATWDAAGNTKDSGKAFVTSVTSSSVNTDNEIATAKAVATFVESTISGGKVIKTSPAMTATAGVCTWTINDLNSMPYSIALLDKDNNEIVADINYTNTGAVIKFNSSTNISASEFTARILL